MHSNLSKLPTRYNVPKFTLAVNWPIIPFYLIECK